MSRPRLLFVNQHYWPDVAATGQILTDLAEDLVRRGFVVDVLTGRGKYVSGDLAAPAQEVRNGVRIRRLATTSFGRGSNAGRVADYAGYYAGVVRRLLSGPRYDLVVVCTTPPLLGYAASLARRLRGQRYAVWSMDLHPDAEIALGMLRPDSVAARRLHAFNDAGYRHADVVVDLGFRMKERIASRGVPASRQETIGVWSSSDEVRPVEPADNGVRRSLGLRDDQLTVMYSGNAGLAHRFDEVLEAMRLLRDDDQFRFVFIGSGPRRAAIEAFIAEHRLANASVHDYVPREQIAESLSAADVHLLTLQEAFAGIAVPSKLYGIMAAGRPTLMVGPERSEPGQTIQEHGVGEVIDPEKGGAAADVVAALHRFADDPDARRATGRQARAVFEAEFDRPILTERWAQMLAERLGLELAPAVDSLSEGNAPA
ncbi:glycosyltransferase family 4 protein [Rubrivirga sp.]|uniref:glycosyltransferase family 4 protein n=1 Tax=Rubrivirga sp. TaxID=1885344 RepID=UPI003B526AD1